MPQTFLQENATVDLLNISNKTNERACIMAHTREIARMQNRWADYQPISCTTYFQCSNCKTWCYKGKCDVACGHWHLLQMTSDEKTGLRNNDKTASINLVDHFNELIPYSNQKVGLVTYQNGINNNYEDHFAGMGSAIRSYLNEGVLSIGFYNESKSIALDLVRMQCEFFGIRTEVVRSMRKMFTTLANRLLSVRPHPHWLHVAHSEGGRIAHDTLQSLSYEARVFCLNHLIVHTYGSIQPIPERMVKEVTNTYARDDIAYSRYGVPFESYEEYKIKVVKSLVKHLFPIPGDHGFLGKTYQEALEENIKDIRNRPGIYNAKN